MKLLGKLLGAGTSELVNSVGGAIDRIHTSESEKLLLKKEVAEIITDKLESLVSAQKEVLLAELKGGKLQRSWRPIVMLAFASIVVYGKFIAPAFGLPNAELEPEFWNLLELGIGGYVIGRTLEKVAVKVTNADFFKKDRKNK